MHEKNGPISTSSVTRKVQLIAYLRHPAQICIGIIQENSTCGKFIPEFHCTYSCGLKTPEVHNTRNLNPNKKFEF